jgi:uncharacterized repeat protein (TIGR01451 family)
MTLGKSQYVDTAQPGETLTYVINYSNNGGPAQGVTISDEVPEFTTLSWASGQPGYPSPAAVMVIPVAGPVLQTVQWTLPTLPGGGSGAVTMAVVIDPNINSASVAGRSGSVPGGQLFLDTFESPTYQVGTNYMTTGVPNPLWTVNPSDVTLYPIILNGGNQVADLIGPGDGDSVSTISTFQSTTSFEIDVIPNSPVDKADIWLGAFNLHVESLFIALVYPYPDSVNNFNFGNNPYVTGATYHLQAVYEPYKGVVKAYMARKGGAMIVQGSTSQEPMATNYQVRALNEAGNQDFQIDNVQVYRGVANKVIMSAINAASVTACDGVRVPPPPGSTPVPTITNTATFTPTKTMTSTASFTSTSTPTATCTPTMTVVNTDTSTSTATMTWTSTATVTPTLTLTPTVTSTSSPTDTPTQTNTPTQTSTVTYTLTPQLNIAKMTLGKSQYVDTAQPGDTLTYVINYSNTGGPAQGVTLTDEVPEFSALSWASGQTGYPHAQATVTTIPQVGQVLETVQWIIPNLSGSGAVTMAVVIDPNINSLSVTGRSGPVTGGMLFLDTFEPPAYIVGTDNMASGHPVPLWTTNASDAPYYPIESYYGSQWGALKGSGINPTASDFISSAVSFQGTTSFEMDFIPWSNVTKTYVYLGAFLLHTETGFIALEYPYPDGANNSSFGHYPFTPGAIYHLRTVYEPYKGVAKAIVTLSGDTTPQVQGSTSAEPVTTTYGISAFNYAGGQDFWIDNVQVYRGVANKVIMSAINAASVTACDAVEVPPPPGSTPVSSMSLASSKLKKAGLVEGATFTPTPTLTPTPSPTLTPSPTPVNNQLVVVAPNISKDGEPVKFMVNLEKPSQIKLSLFNLVGEQVYQTNISGESGTNTLLWQVNNQKGEPVASGLYIYVVSFDNGSGFVNKVGKVVVLH